MMGSAKQDGPLVPLMGKAQKPVSCTSKSTMANAKTSSDMASEFDGLRDIKGEFPPTVVAENGKGSTAKPGSMKKIVKVVMASKGSTAPEKPKQPEATQASVNLNKRKAKVQGKENLKQAVAAITMKETSSSAREDSDCGSDEASSGSS
jgi:hypothetical protein